MTSLAPTTYEYCELLGERLGEAVTHSVLGQMGRRLAEPQHIDSLEQRIRNELSSRAALRLRPRLGQLL